MVEPPNDPKAETAAALLRGAISSIPFVGSVISEVGNLYLNPLEQRKQRWMASVSSAINEISERFALLPEDLQKNEAFVSFLYQATILALKNHQKEKLDALRNALVSSVRTPQISEDVVFQFLRYADELSVTHLRILSLVDKHAGQFARFDKLEQVYQNLNRLIGAAIDRPAFRAFLHDLDARFLIRIGDLEDLAEYASKQSPIFLEGSTKRNLGVTSLGRSFLSFIAA